MPRLYIGGLAQKVTEKSLTKLFSTYGKISDIEIKERKDEDGNVTTRFSYLNIEPETNSATIQECLQSLNGSTWKDGTLKVERARESFLERLKREREEKENNHVSNKQEDFSNNSYNFNTTNPNERQQESYSSGYGKDENYYPEEASGGNRWNNDNYNGFESNNNYSKGNSDGVESYEDNSYRNNSSRDKKSYNENSYSKTNSNGNTNSNDDYEAYRSKFLGTGKKFGKDSSMKVFHQDEQTADETSGFSENKKPRNMTPKPPVFHNIKRYYPTADEKKVDQSESKSEKKMFVEVKDRLQFNQSSGFSLTSLFGKKDDEESLSPVTIAEENKDEDLSPVMEGTTEEENKEEDINEKPIDNRLKELAAAGPSIDETNNISDDADPERKPKMDLSSKPALKKRRNFFAVDDGLMREAVEWATTPLTNEARDEFTKVREELLDILKFQRKRAYEAERDTHKSNNYRKAQGRNAKRSSKIPTK